MTFVFLKRREEASKPGVGGRNGVGTDVFSSNIRRQKIFSDSPTEEEPDAVSEEEEEAEGHYII